MAASRAVSSGLEGEQASIFSKVWRRWCPSCVPAPAAHLTQWRCSRRAGVDHQARSAGAGGEGSELGVLERWWWGLGVGRRFGGVESGKRGVVHGGRGMWTWGGDGPRGGVRWIGSGGSRAPESYSGASGSGSGESGACGRGGVWWRRGSGRAGNRSVLLGATGSGAVCGSGLLRGASRATWGASVVPRGHRAVLPGIGEDGESLLSSVDPPCRRVATGEGGGVAGFASATIQWWLRGVSRKGVALGRRGFLGVGVVAGRIWFLVGGGWCLVVGWVVGLSVRWMVKQSQVMVLSVRGGPRAGGVGWLAVVVVVVGLLVMMVVVVVVVLVVVVVVVVVGPVVVMVLRVQPQDLLALWRDPGGRASFAALGAAGLGGCWGWFCGRV